MSVDIAATESFEAGPASFRQPPHNNEAEQSVLGAMMLSPDAMADVIEILRGGDFYHHKHEMIFDTAIRLYNAGDPVDALSVSAELTKRGEIKRIGGAEYLHTLVAGVPSAASAGYYATLVYEQAILRRLTEAGTRISNMGFDGDSGDIDDIVNLAQAEIYQVTERRASTDYAQLVDLLEGTLDTIAKAAEHEGKLTGVPTGFEELDELTGGFLGGQMIVVAARPAIGKSTLGLDLVRSAAIHHNTAAVIFSLEMGATEIVKRMLSAESEVSLTQLNKGTLSNNDWDKLVQASTRVSTAPLFIDDSPNMSLMEIRAKCRRLKQQHNLGLVVVDYLQLMSSGKKVESRQQEVSEFSRALKLLAKELNVPVIAISQLNRGPEQRQEKRPMLSDMRESGAIEQDADIVILLHREDAYDNEVRPGEADFIVAKHRSGPTKTITVAFRSQVAKFADMNQQSDSDY